MRTISKRLLLGAVVALVVALLALWPWRQSGTPPAIGPTERVSPASTSDTSSGTLHSGESLLEPDPSRAPALASAEISTLPPRSATRRTKPAAAKTLASRTEIASVSGRLDSWEDWNSSFADTAVRTCSAIFDSARIDTMAGGVLGFAAEGKKGRLVPISQIFCRIDSVKNLVKYTFPGQGVEFSIGVGFHLSPSFSGNLSPDERFCRLTFVGTPERGHNEESGPLARNQVLLLLTSPPGYSYVLRVGIECRDSRNPGVGTIYYTRPTIVEFRRMIRYQTLLGGAGDTILLVTNNPKAAPEVARAAPRSIVSAVFIPAGVDQLPDPVGPDLPNLRVRRTPARSLRESILILSASEALVEARELDPEFRNILQLRRKEERTEQAGYPRVTTYVTEKMQVGRLRSTFDSYLRASK